MVRLRAIFLFSLLLSCAALADNALSLRCQVVQATTEEHSTPYFDAKAKAIKHLLDDLPFNTFRTLKESEEKVDENLQTKVALNPRYTMTMLTSGTDSTGRIRLIVRVNLLPKEPDKSEQQVLETTLLLAPGGKARVCGLRCEKERELIVGLTRI